MSNKNKSKNDKLAKFEALLENLYLFDKYLIKRLESDNRNEIITKELYDYELTLLLKSVIKISNENNFYWKHCSLVTYKTTLEERFKVYKTRFYDGEKIDFYILELELIKNLLSYNYDENGFPKLHEEYIYIAPQVKIDGWTYSVDFHMYESMKLTNQKKIEFLEDLIQNPFKPKIDENLEQQKDDFPKQVQQNKKINWTGTAGEFMTIMNVLINQNYIEGFKTNKSKIENLLTHFEVLTEKLEPVTVKTLENYISDKKDAFNPSELKIPKSKNNR